MQQIARFLLLIGSIALLCGCGKDNTMPPMPLSKIAPQSIQVKTLWQSNVGAGTDGQFLNLGIAVADNMVYASDATGKVYAVSLATGKRQWQTNVGMVTSATVGVEQGKVFVNTIRGQLIALDAQTGQVLWRSDLSSMSLSPPAVANGIVVSHTHDGNVSALNVKTGKQRWRYDGSTPVINLEGDSSPTISGNTVVVGSSTGRVVALALKTGVVLWERGIALPSGANPISDLVDIDSKPIIKNNMIYVVAYHSDLVALDLADGKLLWQHPVSAYHNISYDAGKIFVTDATGKIFAFASDTGQEIWVQDQLQYRQLSAPAVVNGRYIVVGDYAGYVHFLSVKNGTLLARIQIDSKAIRSQPVAVGKTVVVNSVSGRTVLLKPLS